MQHTLLTSISFGRGFFMSADLIFIRKVMADNNTIVGVSIQLDVPGSEQVPQVTEQIKKLNDTATKTGKIDLSQPMLNYKQAILQATSEAQKLTMQFGLQDAATVAAIKRVAELKRNFADYQATIKAYDPKNLFAGVANLASSVTLGLRGVVAGMELLGIKSKGAQEAVAKLYALQALSQSFKALPDIVRGFTQLATQLGLTSTKTVANTAAVADSTVAQTDNTTAVAANTTAAVTNTEVVLDQTAATVAQTQADLAATAAKVGLTEATIAQAASAGSAGATGAVSTVASDGGGEEAAAGIAITTAAIAANSAAKVENAAATTESTTAQAANTAETETVVAVQGAATVATEATTVATKALKVSLYSLGIGAIIALVSLLAANWDEVKSSVSGLFPALTKTSDFFTAIKNDIIGVGNVIFNYLIDPYKALYKLLTGDLQGALADLKKGFAFSANFQAGQNIGIVNDEKAKNAKMLALQIEANERTIKELKALGKDTTDLKRDNDLLKEVALDKSSLSDEEYAKKYADLESDMTVDLNEQTKKRLDKQKEVDKKKAEQQAAAIKKQQEQAAAALKEDNEKIKKNNLDALKIIAEGSQSERAMQQADLNTKFALEFAVLEKRKATNKDYNQDYLNLTEAKKLEEVKLNKKYDDQIKDYLAGVNVDTISSYDKTIQEIDIKIKELKKNATPDEIKQLDTSRNEQVNKITTIQTLDKGSKASDSNLKKSQVDNSAVEGDTPEQAKKKVFLLAAAEYDAENAAFELKKSQLQGQNDAEEDLAKTHEAALTKIRKDASDKNKSISQSELEAKSSIQSAEVQLLGQFGGVLESIAGKNKAIAIAGIVAEQAAAVGNILINTHVANAKAVAASPLTAGQPWVTINSVSGALGVAASIIAARNAIAGISSGTAGSSAGTTSAPVSAPQINSSILGSNATGTGAVVGAVNNNTASQSNQRVYIVDKDLAKADAKRVTIKNNSTY